MNFKEQVRDALERGDEPESLTKLVQRFCATGGSKSKAYETLQEIWLEHGFDDDDHGRPDRKRDGLEFVMERVWYWDQ